MTSVSKLDKEKAKLVQDKCQLILGQMLRDEDNKFCVDCDAKGPRWASWNLGIFLCIRCAGIHRNLGVHISRVKSVNLDSWTPEQVVTLQQMGNSRARAVYEANLPDNFRRPQTDSTLESFIRAKYEHKKYIAKEWVAPAPVKVSWDAEIEFELKQKKDVKRKAVNSPSGAGVSLPTPVSAKPTTTTPKVEPNLSTLTSVQAKETSEAPVSVTSLSQDLLGLDISSSTSVNNDNDIFGALLSGPQLVSATNGSASSAAPAASAAVTSASVGIEAVLDTRSTDEDNFFNQKLPAANEKKPLDKDSILALYNKGGSSSMPTTMFTQPGLYGGHQPAYNQSGVAAPAHALPNQMAQGGLFPNQVFATGAYGMQPNAPMTQQLAGLSLGATPAYGHPAMGQMVPNMVPGMAFPRQGNAAASLPASQLNAALNGQTLPPNFWH